MKTHPKTLILALMALLFSSFSLLHGAVLVNEPFSSAASVWSGSSWDNINKLQIAKGNTATKTYDLGLSRKNQDLKLTLNVCSSTSTITLSITTNGVSNSSSLSTTCKNQTFDITTDNSGKVKLELKNTYTSSSGTRTAYIKSVKIETIPPTIVIPNQDALVNNLFNLSLPQYITGDKTDATYVLSNAPSWLTLTGDVLKGTPPTVTEHKNIKVKITNADGETSTATFTIKVLAKLISSGGRDFIQREQYSLFGDVKVIGNTVLCPKNASGKCTESSNGTSNNGVNLQRVSSTAELVLPKDANVTFARIYWQSRYGTSNMSNSDKEKAETIWFRKDSNDYEKLTADIIDYDIASSNVRIYSASANAIDIVTGSGNYGVNAENFLMNTGTTGDGLGAYGAWTLVVVYNDPNDLTARNITIFDGFRQVGAGAPIEIEVEGFLTPKTGDVDSKVYVFAGEGDKYLTGDGLYMAGKLFNQNYKELATSHKDGTKSNAFNSRIDVDAPREPSLTNNNGIDIHQYNVGTSGEQIIKTDEVGAKFHFTSTQDVYFPSLIVFSTELYLPQLCYDYSIKQDGYYLDIDRDTYPTAQLHGKISSSDIDILVYLRNDEADVAAEGISITSKTQKIDENGTLIDRIGSENAIFNHTGSILTSNINGSALINRGAPQSTTNLIYDLNEANSVSDNGRTDGHDIRKGLGTLAASNYVYVKYTLKPTHGSGLVDINASLGLSLDYYIKAEGSDNKIPYSNYELGGPNVPLCPPVSSYQPEWGQFNVVPSGQKLNNLSTQISRKPFSVDVIFDAKPENGSNAAPDSDLKTTVLVEIIDVGSFGDINASCANPDASLTEPIALHLDIKPSKHQTLVTPQLPDYYNFAVRNGAYRVWFFTDQNGSLIEDWTAVTASGSSGKQIESINGLYDKAAFPICEPKCNTLAKAKTTDCFNCIKINYARPLCSRDNFSVRPESFDVRIYDINSAADNTTKNATKKDLSHQYKFAPTESFPTSRINLAAGQMYRFDINATGHDSLERVPGYTRNFDKRDDYNATLYWGPGTDIVTGCNDTEDKSITFYVANGNMKNEERNHEQVGKYKLSIIDKSWTAVDYLYTSHHNQEGFNNINNSDCIINNATTVGPTHGCYIQSNHQNTYAGHTYKDHDLTFHPYEFLVSDINQSVGLNFDPDAQFVYMNDLNNSIGMSRHLATTISAVAKGSSVPLSNFTNNCYAKELDLFIKHSDINETLVNNVYQYQMVDANSSIALHPTILDLNSSIKIPKTVFHQGLKGSAKTFVHLNFKRGVNAPVNPIPVTINRYEAKCTNANINCQSHVDLELATADLNATIDRDMIHYYGRSFVNKQRYPGQTGTAPLNYEVYCNRTEGCTLANFAGTNISLGGDAHWLINSNHDVAIHGGTGTVKQTSGTKVEGTDITIANPNSTVLVYNGSRGFPYATTMEHKPAKWLIYNKHNPAAVANQFDVEFVDGQDGSWAGKHETNSETNATAAQITNRRTMW